jgi:hypothetical protein
VPLDKFNQLVSLEGRKRGKVRGRTTTECGLSGGRHLVRFVEDDELEASTVSDWMKALDQHPPRLRKRRPSTKEGQTSTHPFPPLIRVLAKFLICSLTTSIPLSSLAFNSRQLFLIATPLPP